MFEKFSGFFKRFTRRQKKQSGETTIMDAKEPGLDETALDESFGDLSDLEQSIDKIGTAPVGTDDQTQASVSFSDAELGTGETDFTTGGSDFDAQTISDEISGGKTSGFEEAGPQAEPRIPFAAEVGESPFGEPVAAPKKSVFKRILVTVGIVILTLALGGAFQIFGWPHVSKMVGVASKEKPQFDVTGQLEASKRENAKLKTEVADFKKIGSPAEAKALQQQIAQARDSQGPVEDLEKQFSEAKEKETAYDELVKKVNALDSEIANTRSEIGVVRSHIDDARQKVMALRKQSELEYARFQNELARAEISQRTLLELQKEDNQRFQEELKNLQEYLSRLNAEQAPAAPAESAVAPAPDTGAVGS